MAAQFPVKCADLHADAEAKAVVTDQAVYSSNGITTTVTIAALDFFPDEDSEDRRKDDCGSSSSDQESPEDSSKAAQATGWSGSGSGTTGQRVLRHSYEEGSADDHDLAERFPTCRANELVRGCNCLLDCFKTKLIGLQTANLVFCWREIRDWAAVSYCAVDLAQIIFL